MISAADERLVKAQAGPQQLTFDYDPEMVLALGGAHRIRLADARLEHLNLYWGIQTQNFNDQVSAFNVGLVRYQALTGALQIAGEEAKVKDVVQVVG